MTIAELAKAYDTALQQAETLKEEADKAKKAAEKLEEELYNRMLEEETTMLAVNGIGVLRPAVKVRASCRAGMQEDLFHALRENGYGDIIKEQVNANTLSALMKDISEQGGGTLPDWVNETCNIYNQRTISVRKK